MSNESENMPPRVVVDSNVFVSATIRRRGAPYELLRAWRAAAFVVLMTPQQRHEIGDVLRRPRIAQQYRIAANTVVELLDFIDEHAEQVAIASAPPVTVRDPKDAPILAAAIAGHADYLVTGDADLLVLADDPDLHPLRIVTIRAMLDILGAD